jgi:preprotein translocase subunit YajC
MGLTGSSETLWWIFILGLSVVFLFLPQWLARRRQAQRVAAFELGDRVITIGGFIGSLAAIDREAGIAHLRLAEGVEVEILLEAISRKLATTEPAAGDDPMAGR